MLAQNIVKVISSQRSTAAIREGATNAIVIEEANLSSCFSLNLSSPLELIRH